MSDSYLSAVAARTADTQHTAAATAEEPLPPPPVPNNLAVITTPERGRSLVVTKSAEAGETILAEAPVCWWVDAERHEEVCARCFKVMPLGGQSGCDVCRQACYCSSECRKEDAARHAGVCPMLKAGRTGLNTDATNLLHFCAHAIALQRTTPEAFSRLWSLHSVGTVLDSDERASCKERVRREGEQHGRTLVHE